VEPIERAAHETRPNYRKQIVGNTLQTVNDLKFKPEAIVELVGFDREKTISSSAAQQVSRDVDTGKSPAAIVSGEGPGQVSDTGASRNSATTSSRRIQARRLTSKRASCGAHFLKGQ